MPYLVAVAGLIVTLYGLFQPRITAKRRLSKLEPRLAWLELMHERQRAADPGYANIINDPEQWQKDKAAHDALLGEESAQLKEWGYRPFSIVEPLPRQLLDDVQTARDDLSKFATTRPMVMFGAVVALIGALWGQSFTG